MGSQDGRGMPVAMMKFVVFVSQPLKEWLQVSNIRETSARWYLASVDTPFICNASRHGSIHLNQRVQFVDKSGNMDSRVINEEQKVLEEEGVMIFSRQRHFSWTISDLLEKLHTLLVPYTVLLRGCLEQGRIKGVWS
jgi:hypothetical protein